LRYPKFPTKALLIIIILINISSWVRYAQTNQHNPDPDHTNDAKAKYVIIITIDGLRPDAITEGNVPHIQSLIKKGSCSLEAKTVIPARTLPAHTSLLTGLTPERHGMKINFWVPFMKHVGIETIFSVAKEKGLKTAMFVGKDKLRYLAKPDSVDHFESTGEAPGSNDTIASRFSSYMKTERPELVLIHFPEPDLTGHQMGWMSEDYIKALEQVDRAIKVILESLDEAGIYEHTLLIITSDHGGQGKNHIGSDSEVITIPWIAVGPGVKKGYRINGNVNIYDTAATVLFALGIKPPPNWEGKPIKEVFIAPTQPLGNDKM
jgi:predicted AlkP superfamily pyrophosphatase or phosphodiesterase